MSKTFDAFLSDALEEIELAGLTRRLTPLETPQLPLVRRGDVMVVNFSSNDYLGLAAHPALRDAAMGEWERGGFGSGASRLICGTMTAHEDLEVSIARFKRTPAALAFHSGYAAALGTIPAICGKNDVIIMDKLSHACLIDAARLSGAVLRVFPHNDLNKLESHLAWASRKHPQARVLIVVESVYSMDGDLAKVAELLKLAHQYDALILIDDAHGFGVLGQHGFGILEHAGIQNTNEAAARIIYIGTLGKAAGISGAFVAGHKTLVEWILQKGRPYIYTTASPPAIAHGLLKSLELISDDSYRTSLNHNIQYWKKTLRLKKWGLMPSDTAIQPIMIGKTEDALRVAQQLYQKNIWVPAIRPPTVPADTARLRITFSASHTTEQIDQLTQALMEIEDGL